MSETIRSEYYWNPQTKTDVPVEEAVDYVMDYMSEAKDTDPLYQSFKKLFGEEIEEWFYSEPWIKNYIEHDPEVDYWVCKGFTDSTESGLLE